MCRVPTDVRGTAGGEGMRDYLDRWLSAGSSFNQLYPLKIKKGGYTYNVTTHLLEGVYGGFEGVRIADCLTVSWRQVGTQRSQVKKFYLYIAAPHFIAVVYAGCVVPL